MRIVVAGLILTATPAFAHHEAVVATSMLPLVVTVSTLGLCAFGAVKAYARKKRGLRRDARQAAKQG